MEDISKPPLGQTLGNRTIVTIIFSRPFLFIGKNQAGSQDYYALGIHYVHVSM